MERNRYYNPGFGRPVSNDNEEVIYISQSFRTEASSFEYLSIISRTFVYESYLRAGV